MWTMYVGTRNILQLAYARARQRWFESNDDQTSVIEYGLILAGVGVGVVSILYTLGNDMSGFFAFSKL